MSMPEEHTFHSQYSQLLFQLLQLPALGRVGIRKILLWCHKNKVTQVNFWKHAERACAHVSISKKAVESIQNYNIEHLNYNNIESIQKEGIRVIFWWESAYPPLLREREDHPLCIFAKGKTDLLSSQSTVAVVGTRHMTAYGAFVTKKIVADLVVKDQVIVSGGMYGVDVCAHQAALAAGGGTVVVLGYGFNHVYPAHLRAEYEHFLTQNTCFITEYFPEQLPKKAQFVVRNGIVAGMSQAVLVTEAAMRSGTHTTCQYALENGSGVFAVAGPITSPFSQGTQWLVNQGATLISSGFELLDELHGLPFSWQTTQEKIKTSNDTATASPEEKILTRLKEMPQATQQLSEMLGMGISQTMSILTKLELVDSIIQEAGVWHLV